MNPYPMWRLLLRPSMPFWIAGFWIFSYGLGIEAIGVLISGSHEAAEQDGSLLLGRSLFLLCAAIGLACGQAIQEAQHCAASFHLPGLRSGFRSGAALTGLIAAALTTATYALLGGHEALPCIGLLNLAGFGLGLALIDPLGSFFLTLLNLAAVFWAATSLEWLTGFVALNPLSGLAAGLLVLGWISVRTLGTHTFRRKPLIPFLAVISFFSLPVEKNYSSERLRLAAPKERPWPVAAIQGSTWRWIRAAIYGASGFRRLGWVASNAAGSILLALLVLGSSLLEGAEEGGGLALGLGYAYRGLVYTASNDPFPGGQGIDYWALNWYAGVFWMALAFGYPIFLRTSKVYPLSRRDLGRVTYWTGALHLGLLAISTFLALAALHLLLAWQTGYPWWPGHLPALLRTVLINAALLPVVQRWRLAAGCSPGWKSRGQIAFAVLLAYCAALTFGVKYWAMLAASLSPLAEALILILLICLMQWWYRRQVMRHFLRADLA